MPDSTTYGVTTEIIYVHGHPVYTGDSVDRFRHLYELGYVVDWVKDGRYRSYAGWETGERTGH